MFYPSQQCISLIPFKGSNPFKDNQMQLIKTFLSLIVHGNY